MKSMTAIYSLVSQQTLIPFNVMVYL